jgi:hypothetical protein
VYILSSQELWFSVNYHSLNIWLFLIAWAKKDEEEEDTVRSHSFLFNLNFFHFASHPSVLVSQSPFSKSGPGCGELLPQKVGTDCAFLTAVRSIYVVPSRPLDATERHYNCSWHKTVKTNELVDLRLVILLPTDGSTDDFLYVRTVVAVCQVFGGGGGRIIMLPC